VSRETKEYFDSISADWDKKYAESFLFRNRYETFKRLIEKYSKEKNSALDYGCGAGNLTKLLSERFKSVTATDLSGEMLKAAANRFNGNENVKVVPLNQVVNSHFDFIICSSVIEYSKEDSELLKGLSSLLNNNGVLIITFPNRFGALQMLNRFILRFITNENYTNYQEHTYTKSGIKTLVNNSGLVMKEFFSQPGILNIRITGDLFFCILEKREN
jgi:2-polyprenyl-3-methyl-5-hydroxy-6-metoxy-1,4-benzoquinol methylase